MGCEMLDKVNVFFLNTTSVGVTLGQQELKRSVCVRDKQQKTHKVREKHREKEKQGNDKNNNKMCIQKEEEEQQQCIHTNDNNHKNESTNNR